MVLRSPKLWFLGRVSWVVLTLAQHSHACSWRLCGLSSRLSGTQKLTVGSCRHHSETEHLEPCLEQLQLHILIAKKAPRERERERENYIQKERDIVASPSAGKFLSELQG